MADINLKTIAKQHWLLILRALISVLSVSMATLTLPFVVGRMVSSGVTFQFSFDDIIYDWGYVLIYIFAFAFFSSFRVFSFGTLAEKIGEILRQYSIRQLFENNAKPHQLDSVLADIKEIEWVIETTISQFLRNLMVMLGGLIFMCYFSIVLTLYLLVMGPIFLLPIYWMMRKYRQMNDRLSRAVDVHLRQVKNMMAHVVPIWFYDRSQWAMQKIERGQKQLSLLRNKRLFLRACLTFVILSMLLVMLFAIYMAGFYQQQGIAGLDANELLQFALFVFLVGISGSGAGELSVSVGRARDCYRHVLLLAQKDAPASLALEAFSELSVLNLSVTPEEGVEVLRDVSFNVRPGEKIAVVGASGSGKSSLLRAILGIDAYSKGEIKINGRLVSESPLWWRTFFAPVIDHPPILEASVEDNLTYGRQGVDMALLERWLEKVKLGDGELFDGDWSKELSDISSGQKQRVQTLCALNQGRDILVLDEVTSQLDLESQKAVHELILSMPQTVLFATHQIDFMVRADRVLFFHQGGLVADGAFSKVNDENDAFQALIEGEC